VTLDDLAHRHHTDKGTRPIRGYTPKGYTTVYERLLGRRRLDPLNVLEIGVGRGGSLRMWSEWMPQATIIGLDVTDRPGVDVGRAHRVLGDQASPAVLADLIARWAPFDLVVDDGGHQHHQHVASWTGLWPHVTAGGVYAVEDLRATPASVPWLTDLGATIECAGQLGVMIHP
jgi:cephalosporin hydroxylase